MAYRVEITARASRDLRRIYQRINADSSQQAQEWFNGLEVAVASLAENPARTPPIPENEQRRHLLYGDRPNVYRVIYVIEQSTDTVKVLHIRHGRQAPLARGDAN
jgi:toxin ParE1/3/4